MWVKLETNGGIALAFSITAENDLERIALREFLRQTEEPGTTFALQGRSYDDNKFGPRSFSFGTVYRDPDEPKAEG